MNARTHLTIAFSIITLLSVGCQTAPRTAEAKATLEQRAQSALTRFKAADSGVDNLLDRAYGHATFPKVGKGGAIIGGAYGKGVVYEQARQIGYADLTQATVGAQLGGQTYAELVVFENAAALDRFKNNQLTFAANASAVAIEKGTSAAADFDNGVAVFTMPNKGAMLEASIGGQKFTFAPVEGSGSASTRPANSDRPSRTID